VREGGAGNAGSATLSRAVETQDFRRALADHIRAQAKPPDKFSHQARLYRVATQVGAGQTYDDDVLYAAAWLHDLGVFVGHRPEDPTELANWDHVAYAGANVPAILKRLDFPQDKTPAVLEAIRTHQPADSPTTVEGVILRDADILEQLGAVGILRAVSKVGRDTRFRTFADALRVLQRNADTLPDRLRLPAARRLAKPRLRVLRDFLDAAKAETGPVEW
jgi:uncharacterized protein